MPKFRLIVALITGMIVLLLILANASAQLYTDWLWFRSLGYQQAFLTIILSDIGLRVIAGGGFFVLLLINLLFTRKPFLSTIQRASILKEDNIITIQESPWKQFISPGYLSAGYFIVSLIIALLFSFSVAGDWAVLQKFLHPSSFGVTDPVFARDIGFYVFQLPFYVFIYKVSSWAIFIIAFLVAAVYLLINAIHGIEGGIFQTISARYHLSFLAALFFALKAWGYQLDQYSLLFGHHGAVWGAGFTAIHANLLAYKILSVVALACAIAIIINIFLQRFRLVVFSIGVLVVTSIVLGSIYPGLVQKLRVTPSEMAIEKPYLESNIQFTRKAYGLDKIEKQNFPAGRELSAGDIQANKDTIENIRLWDWEPLQQTYSQLQEMRLYYEFKDIDIDRYFVDGRYRQVMLAARELNQAKLPEQAKTWVNQRLKYTHGYGVVMSPVNEVSGEGLPAFFLKDIPPATTTNLAVQRPEIYYGEHTDQYVIVNARTPEFDYPKGDDNAYTTYEGNSGVKFDNFLRRLMFAFSLGDYKLLLSSDVDNSSRVLYYRNIHQRVPKIAPFLEYDEDPYLVLSGGKLYWLWDAYTRTDRYPYSEPYDRVNNYIRNAVKVVVDAYTGQVDFYVSDPDDPLISTFSKIFPGMFKPLEQMPSDLRLHLRYPVDLFKIQSRMYTIYHMEDPQVFYNKEDKWNLPTELYGSEEKQMEPYYTIIKIAGEKKPEFVLILPFTPQNKKNMIAWMSARSDGENYGRLLSYSFPKQELVYGPAQLEARINQDTTISQQLSLWDQRGSRVIRGNLLVIPIKDALLYVEPLYLQAEQSKIPELRRVIVVHGDKVVMEPSLEKALERIFGEKVDVGTPAGPEMPAQEPSTKTDISALARQANQLFDEAQSKLKAGDWAGYGETLNRLKQTLTEMASKE